MAEIYGQAINISAENREAIAIVNGGIVPHESLLELEDPSYFVTPCDPEAYNEILGIDEFCSRFVFVEHENGSYFCDVALREDDAAPRTQYADHMSI